MDLEAALAKLLRDMLREAQRETDRAIREGFSEPLEAWLNDLLSRRLPNDWRAQLRAKLQTLADDGFSLRPNSLKTLEQWILAEAERLGVLPSLESRRDIPEYWSHDAVRSVMTEGASTTTEARPTVVEQHVYRSWVDGYDAAIAQGQHAPGLVKRVGMSLYRSLFPPSDPTTVTTLSDGTVHIDLSTGPTSGDLADQASTLITPAVSALRQATLRAAGKALAKEVIDDVADTVITEVTGLAISPRSFDGSGPHHQRSNYNVYEVISEQPITGRSRKAQRDVANRALHADLAENKELRWQYNELFGADVLKHMESGSGKTFINPPGTVWHHPIDNPGVLQLMRTSEHRNPLLQTLLHPEGIGRFGKYYGDE